MRVTSLKRNVAHIVRHIRNVDKAGGFLHLPLRREVVRSSDITAVVEILPGLSSLIERTFSRIDCSSVER